MSAPDEIRQLADRLDPEGLDRMSLGDLRAAAVALRHHANLLDGTHDPNHNFPTGINRRAAVQEGETDG